MNELTRVLKPGGYLYLTVHGTTRIHELTREERKKYDSGQLVIRREKHSGHNVCKVFHPEQYVRQVLAKGLTVVDFQPGGAKDADQDAFLLQKPSNT